MTAKRKMNLILISFGIGAIVVIVCTLGIIMQNLLGNSIELNVKSDLKGFTNTQNAYNYAFSMSNNQMLSTVETHFEINGGLQITDETMTIGSSETKIWRMGNEMINFSARLVSFSPFEFSGLKLMRMPLIIASGPAAT
ncbi:MAG: hypothetical protein IIT32_09985, partial [Bacteroidales bacterium]|nr:hypothetical protein [Bacteroidales bacterium]